jgi:hypothetical protein
MEGMKYTLRNFAGTSQGRAVFVEQDTSLDGRKELKLLSSPKV